MPTPGLLPAPSPAALGAKASKTSSPAKAKGPRAPRQKSAPSIVQRQSSSRSGSASPQPKAHSLKSPKKGGGRQRSRQSNVESSSDRDEVEPQSQPLPKVSGKNNSKTRHRKKPSQSTPVSDALVAPASDAHSKSLPAGSPLSEAITSKSQHGDSPAGARLKKADKQLWDDVPTAPSNVKTEAPTWQQSFFGPGKSSTALARDDSLVGLKSVAASGLTWQQQSLQEPSAGRPGLSPPASSRKMSPVKSSGKSDSPVKTRKQARRQSQPPKVSDSDQDSSRQSTPHDQVTAVYGFSELSLDDSPPPSSSPSATSQTPQTPPAGSRKPKKSASSNLTMTKPRNEMQTPPSSRRMVSFPEQLPLTDETVNTPLGSTPASFRYAGAKWTQSPSANTLPAPRTRTISHPA